MNVGKRIKKRRKQLRISANEMADKLGKNRATVYRYESSEIENMPLDVIEPLARALQVTPGYLMGWEEEEDMPVPHSQYHYYPESISAGIPINVDAVTNANKISIPNSVMGKHAGQSDIFITKINGNSMNKVMPDQSLIAVKPIEIGELKNDDIVVYSENHEYSVKRFYKQGNDILFRPRSTDYRHRDNVYSLDDAVGLEIHGKVVLYIVELD